MTEPVSLIDIFSMILDYTGTSASNKRDDGRSLRPLIEKELYNTYFEETAIASEWDFREPSIKAKILIRKLDDQPNFIIRRWNFKLLIKKGVFNESGCRRSI